MLTSATGRSTQAKDCELRTAHMAALNHRTHTCHRCHWRKSLSFCRLLPTTRHDTTHTHTHTPLSLRNIGRRRCTESDRASGNGNCQWDPFSPFVPSDAIWFAPAVCASSVNVFYAPRNNPNVTALMNQSAAYMQANTVGSSVITFTPIPVDSWMDIPAYHLACVLTRCTHTHTHTHTHTYTYTTTTTIPRSPPQVPSRWLQFFC
jgi:hypothetical protein